MAVLPTFPPRVSGSTERDISEITAYLFQLQEELEHQLSVLDRRITAAQEQTERDKAETKSAINHLDQRVKALEGGTV